MKSTDEARQLEPIGRAIGVGWVKRSAAPTRRRGRYTIDQATAKMSPGCRHILPPFLAAIAATGSAFAQELTPERRLVQAFSSYCVATAAEPARIQAEVQRVATLVPGISDRWGNGGRFETAEIWDSIGRRDPHQRMLITFGWNLGNSGRKRTCQVNVPWGEKAKLVAEVVSNLNLANGTSSVVREGAFDTDLTRWTTRIGNTEAVVELGMPTYASAAGRALTLSLEEP